MRYYIKCKLNPEGRQKLADSIKSGSLARGQIFYEGMQTALREGTIDENDICTFCRSMLLSRRWIVSYGYGDSSFE